MVLNGFRRLKMQFKHNLFILFFESVENYPVQTSPPSVEFSKLIFLIFSWVPLLGASPLGQCWPHDTSSPPRAGERLQAQWGHTGWVSGARRRAGSSQRCHRWWCCSGGRRAPSSTTGTQALRSHSSAPDSPLTSPLLSPLSKKLNFAPHTLWLTLPV